MIRPIAQTTLHRRLSLNIWWVCIWFVSTGRAQAPVSKHEQRRRRYESKQIPPAPFTWSTFLQALKIFVVVVVFLAAQQGIQAFTNTFDWTKLMQAGEVMKVLLAVGMGLIFGTIQGALRAVPAFNGDMGRTSCLGLLRTDSGNSCSDGKQRCNCGCETFSRHRKKGAVQLPKRRLLDF